MTIDIESLGVFQIFTGGGTGTGFLLSDKLLITNCHVVAPYRKVAVEKRDKQRVLGTVRRLHPKRDLAIVELTQPLSGEVLAISQNDDLKPKQALHIIGYPVGLPLSASFRIPISNSAISGTCRRTPRSIRATRVVRSSMTRSRSSP